MRIKRDWCLIHHDEILVNRDETVPVDDPMLIINVVGSWMTMFRWISIKAKSPKRNGSPEIKKTSLKILFKLWPRKKLLILFLLILTPPDTPDSSWLHIDFLKLHKISKIFEIAKIVIIVHCSNWYYSILFHYVAQYHT